MSNMGYIVILAFSIGLLITLMIRNNKTFAYRVELSSLVYKKNLQDIEQGTYKKGIAQSRWDELRRVSYNKQVLMFWRRLDDFHNQDFLKDIGAK